MKHTFRIVVIVLCFFMLAELVFLGYLLYKKMGKEMNSTTTAQSTEAEDTFYANATATPTPLPEETIVTATPTVTIAPGVGAVTATTTTISFNLSGYSTDMFVVEYQYDGGELEAKMIAGTQVKLTGLYSGKTYHVTVKRATTGEVYVEEFTADTEESGYGDPFEGIDGILTTSEGSNMVVLSSETGSLGAKLWAQFDTKLYDSVDLTKKTAKITGGTAMTVTKDENGNYAYLRKKNRWSLYVTTEDGQTGWVDADCMFVDITDLFDSHNNSYGIQINRTNAYSSIFTAGGSATEIDTTSEASTRYNPLKASSGDDSLTVSGYNEIAEVTGRALKNYGSKDQMPVIWDLALELIQCQKNSLRDGCTLLIYEGYRPLSTSQQVSSSMWSNNYLAHTENGKNLAVGFLKGYFDTSYYIAKKSRHNKGTAVDLTLQGYDMDGNLGDELTMQTKMHTLDYRGNMAYNNDSANMLYDIMTEKTNLECLSSKQEWWHFQLPNDSSLYPQINNYIYADYEI
jgi:D-alanyl-D-alanine dipeptidase